MNLVKMKIVWKNTSLDPNKRISLRNETIEYKIFEENIANVQYINGKKDRLLVKLYFIASKNNFSISTII